MILTEAQTMIRDVARRFAGQSVGMARAALDFAARYATERVAFDKPLFDHQAVAWRLADMDVQVEAARHLTLHAARLKDSGVPCLRAASTGPAFRVASWPGRLRQSR
jgi:hypothetical protein